MIDSNQSSTEKVLFSYLLWCEKKRNVYDDYNNCNPQKIGTIFPNLKFSTDIAVSVKYSDQSGQCLPGTSI